MRAALFLVLGIVNITTSAAENAPPAATIQTPTNKQAVIDELRKDPVAALQALTPQNSAEAMASLKSFSEGLAKRINVVRGRRTIELKPFEIQYLNNLFATINGQECKTEMEDKVEKLRQEMLVKDKDKKTQDERLGSAMAFAMVACSMRENVHKLVFDKVKAAFPGTSEPEFIAKELAIRWVKNISAEKEKKEASKESHRFREEPANELVLPKSAHQ